MRKFRSHCVRYHRLYSLLFIASLPLFVAACSTSWVQEAQSIVQLLIPAVEAALGILAAAGLGLPATVVQGVQSWGAQAQGALTQVASLIQQYNSVEASAQPGVLIEIQNVLGVVTQNLNQLLPTIKVTNPSTQAKVEAVVQAIADEMTALVNLIPAVQSATASGASAHDQLKRIVSDQHFAVLKSAKEFKEQFNKAATQFGSQYAIK